VNVYEEIREFYIGFKGEKAVIGRSEEGRYLFAFFVGEHRFPVGICQCAMHAREYATAYIALAQMERGLEKGGCWFVPLMNPDGALLVEEGIDSVKAPWRREMLLRVNGKEDFSLWKANAEAVDLNVNFDAGWGTGRSNRMRPAPESYIGSKPFSASESKALKNFTYCVCPHYTVSYHTKGEELYWRYRQPFFRAIRDKRLAGVLSDATGYPMAEAIGSAGGYKDWCVEKLKIPAFTVEAGSDSLSHPISKDMAAEMIERNADALNALHRGF